MIGKGGGPGGRSPRRRIDVSNHVNKRIHSRTKNGTKLSMNQFFLCGNRVINLTEQASWDVWLMWILISVLTEQSFKLYE